jgi:hypothetical protein
MNKQGKAKAEYDKAYNARPEQKENRAARGRARYAYEKEHGDLPRNVDVDHKTPIKKGGGNHMGNLRAMPASKNRARGN